MYELNEEQQSVAHAIQNMSAGDRLVVSGRAGSGKTFAIAKSVANIRAMFLAPTHPAKKVLERELACSPHTVLTIHKAIGCRKKRNNQLQDVQTYLPAADARRRLAKAQTTPPGSFLDVDILIVDECSMVGAFLFDAVEEYAKEFNLPVVYSGDQYQLPPVDDIEVIPAQGFRTIKMDGSIRFGKNSEIFRYGELLRDWIDNRPGEELPKLVGKENIQVLPGIEWAKRLVDGYAGGDNLLAVTFDNETLTRLRKTVRQADDDKLQAGNIVASKQTDEAFRNGETLTIEEVKPANFELLDVPECVSSNCRLNFIGSNISFLETHRTAFVLAKEKQKETLERRVRELHRDRKICREQAERILDWIGAVNRFELEALATVHKSQGRSVDDVFVDTETVLKRSAVLSPRAHKRLLYTAITRARENVVFYRRSGLCEQEQPDQLQRAA